MPASHFPSLPSYGRSIKDRCVPAAHCPHNKTGLYCSVCMMGCGVACATAHMKGQEDTSVLFLSNLYMGFQESNLGPQACTENTFAQ